MFRLWILAALAALTAPVARSAPLELYGQLPNIEAMSISPDGQRLGLVWTDGVVRRIAVKDLSTGKMSQVLNVGPAKVRGVLWVGPQHLIVTASKTAWVPNLSGPRREWLMAYDLNVVTGKLRPLLAEARGAAMSMNAIFSIPEGRIIDGKPVLFATGVSFVSNFGCLSVFQIDLETDRATLVAQGERYTRGWVIGQDGKPFAQSLYNPETGRWALKLKTANGGWREVESVASKAEAPGVEGLGRDGRSVLLREMVDGADLIREMSREGVAGPPLDIEEDEAAIFDPVRHNLIGYSALIGEEQRYKFFDEHDQQVWAAVRRAYPDERLQLVGWSDDRKRIVVLADSPTEGPTYALVDLDTRKASWIGGRYEDLKAEDIAPVRRIAFTAQDGLPLTGYLTTPRGAPAKGLPLVVFPHGGPAVRDEPGFEWWAQAMASRGYAVLQVNFRGSGGLGWKFLSAGFGQWGRKMQTDLSDGVRYLAKAGTIDPTRVCIVGASYGGYAAMAGPTLDPGVYRCAAAYAGIADLATFVPWVRTQTGAASQRYLIRFLGAESARDASLTQISPARNVDRAAVPILLIHGKDDTVVPLSQSQAMANAMKRAGKPVDLLVLDSTDHWLTQGETRLAMLQATIAFLEKNNPPH